jgi:hypothetical protein
MFKGAENTYTADHPPADNPVKNILITAKLFN